MLEQDAIYAKIDVIKNCLTSIETINNNLELSKTPEFREGLLSINLQRSCQAAIDIAHLLISLNGLSLPTHYKESFEILYKNKFIDEPTKNIMQKMVGYRNIAVHDYKRVSSVVLESIIKNHLIDFEKYYEQILKHL